MGVRLASKPDPDDMPGKTGKTEPVAPGPAWPVLGRRDPEATDGTAELPSTAWGSTITASEPEPELTDTAAGDRVDGVAPVAMAGDKGKVGRGVGT